MPAFLRAAKVLSASSPSTISAFDSTGADLLILEIDGASTATNTATVSDSQGNTWTKLTLRGNNSNQQQATWYCLAPTKSASHNFTQTGAAFSSFKVSAWSGVAAFDQETGRANGSAANVSPGTITPSVNGCLILCLACSRTAGTITIDSGFTIADQNPFVSGVNCGNGTAYLVQTTAAAVTPSWSATMEGNLVVFTPAAAANVGTAAGTSTAAGVSQAGTLGVGSAAGTSASSGVSPSPPPTGGFLRTAYVTSNTSPSSISSFDSTGADLLILTIDGASTAVHTATVSDSLGNTWTKLTNQGNNSNQEHSSWYCSNPTTSATHNFTQTGGTFSTFRVSAYQGFDAFDKEVGHGLAGVYASPGTVTPSVSNSLILALGCSRTTGSYTIDSGFTIDAQNPFVGGINCGSAHASLTQGSPAAVTPTWSNTMTSNLVVFKPAAVHNVGSAAGTSAAAAVSPASSRSTGTAAGSSLASALSPVTGGLYRFASPINHDHVTGGGTLQGICIDPAGNRFWVSVSSQLRIYDGSWASVSSRTTTGDSPTTKTQITNMAYDGTTLYVGANNYPNSPVSGWVLEYDPTTLAFITNHPTALGHYCEGVFIRNGEFWTCYHDWPYVSRYSAAWVHLGDYPLPGAISDQTNNLFQGGTWSGDYLYLVIHNNTTPTTYWCYLWDDGAETFTLIESRNTPFTESLYCGQGLNIDEPNGKMYFAQRNGLGDGNIVETTLVPPSTTNIGNGWTLLDSVQACKTTGLQEIVLNTTGADLIVLSCMSSTGTVTFTDQRGNSIAGTPISNTSDAAVRLFVAYIKPIVKGIGHRFTATGGSFETFSGAAFSGSAASSPLDGSASAVSATQAGSITPTADGDLILAFLDTRSSVGPYSADSGMTVSDQTAYLSGWHNGAAIAYFTQTTAAAINPTWNTTGTVGIVAFKRGVGIIPNVGTAAGTSTATAVPAPGGVSRSSGTAVGSSTANAVNSLAPTPTDLVSSSTPAWVTDFNDSWNSLFPNAMNTYTSPLWTYHTVGTSGLVADPHDFGSVLNGTWSSTIDYTDISGIASVFVELSVAGPEAAKAVTNATNATPIVLTIPGHPYATGDEVEFSGIGGNPNANGHKLVTVIDADHVSLTNLFGGVVPGNGAYTSGGIAQRWVWSKYAGTQVKAPARWARVRIVSSDTLLVNSLGSIHCSVVARSEKSPAPITSSVSGGVLVQLSGTYTAAQSVVVTPYGSGFLIGVADRILVAPDTGLFFTTTHAGSGNLYTYQRFSSLARTVLSDDYLEYDVYLVASPAANQALTGGMEINFNDSTSGRSIGLVDQSGYSINGYGGGLRGAWNHRRISLAAAAGKSTVSFDAVVENDTNGRYATLYRNIQITDSAGAQRVSLWDSGEPSANAIDYQSGATNVELGPSNSFLAYAFNSSNAQVAVPISWEFNGV